MKVTTLTKHFLYHLRQLRATKDWKPLDGYMDGYWRAQTEYADGITRDLANLMDSRGNYILDKS